MSTQLWHGVWDVNSALWADGVYAPSLPSVSSTQGCFLHGLVEASAFLSIGGEWLQAIRSHGQGWSRGVPEASPGWVSSGLLST